MATPGKPRDTAPPPRRNFYAPDHDDTKAAAEIEGLEHEIAVLRVKFKELLANDPVDHALVMRMAEILVRAVTAQYRLSPRAGKNMAAHLTALLNDVGDQLLSPER
jgi:hypothetical protein